MTDEVCRSVRLRINANKYRRMRRVCGVNNERTESAKADYFKEKEETKDYCIAFHTEQLSPELFHFKNYTILISYKQNILIVELY